MASGGRLTSLHPSDLGALVDGDLPDGKTRRVRPGALQIRPRRAVSGFFVSRLLRLRREHCLPAVARG
jgi:hypothetical protein